MKEVWGSMALNMDMDMKRKYTTEDIRALPDGIRAELYDGRLIYMETPSMEHQRILAELLYEFMSYQKKHNGKCRTFPAPTGVYLSDEFNYLEPDLVIVCPKDENDQRLRDRGIFGAPDFVLEIVSPSSRLQDYYRKTSRFLEAGVREYWIVDPMKRTVTVNDFEGQNQPAVYTFEDHVPVRIYGDLEIHMAGLGC